MGHRYIEDDFSELSFAELTQRYGLTAVPRVAFSDVTQDELTRKILESQTTGIPLVISGFNHRKEWDDEVFSIDWLSTNYGTCEISARDVVFGDDFRMLLNDLLQRPTFDEHGVEIPPPQLPDLNRLYGKDLFCPPEWRRCLESGLLPPLAVPGGVDDLHKYLNDKERVETLMTYQGRGGTFTTFHKDSCASQGYNLMTYASSGSSAIWFFTKSSDSVAISTHFQSVLKTELDWEHTFLSLAQLAALPCEVFICEQHLGDMVVVPPRSCHQVMNVGLDMLGKAAWSTVPFITLDQGIKQECLIARRICRREIYRMKTTCFRAVVGLAAFLRTNYADSDAPKHHLNNLRSLITLLDLVLASEWGPEPTKYGPTSKCSSSALLFCDFCGSDIFESYFECSKCVDRPATLPAQPFVHPGPQTPSPGPPTEDQVPFCTVQEPTAAEGSHSHDRNVVSNESNCADGADPGEADEQPDNYDMCPACVVEGRSCACGDMRPRQQFPFKDLVIQRNEAATLIEGLVPLDDQYFQQAQSDRMFRAGLELVHERSKDKKLTIECLANRDTDQHSVPWYAIAPCPKDCKRNVCHKHALIIRRSHASEGILARTGTEVNYHSNHSGTGPGPKHEPLNDKWSFIGTFGKSFGRSPEDKAAIPSVETFLQLPSRLRLGWAALAYQQCRPLNDRSRLGWYDCPIEEFQHVLENHPPDNSWHSSRKRSRLSDADLLSNRSQQDGDTSAGARGEEDPSDGPDNETESFSSRGQKRQRSEACSEYFSAKASFSSREVSEHVMND